MPNWTKEQQDAINKENTNIIVSAGAGSGKTAVLTERVIRKLKEGVNINELLILTFTKAAASEMKERIRKSIKQEKSLKKQLEYIDSAYITTFDSYSLSIVKKYHYILNVSPDISVADANLIGLEKEKILDNIFEELYKNHDEKFEKLITDFTTKDDNTIRKNILKISEKLDMNPDKKEYLDSYIDKYYSEEEINKNINLLVENLIKKTEEINRLLYYLQIYSEGEYYNTVLEILTPLINSKTYLDIKNNCQKLPKVPNNSSDELKKYKKEINDIIDEMISICKYEKEEEIFRNIIETKDYVEIIIKIISNLDYEINKFKFEKDLYGYTDIELLAIKLLKENEEIREEIKNNLNEIMIDEYQDTNDLQETFINFVANHNVYMVGDIKQSIYRFRNANPYIFKNKYDLYSKNINGYKIDLNKNFRSREEVLNNINSIFDIIMDNFIGGAFYKDSHRMIFGNDSYTQEGNTKQNNDFEIYNYTYDKESGFSKEEYEIFIIANDIKEKIENKYKIFDKDEKIIRDCNYNDFVILMDKSKHFDLYKKIFEFLNIPLSILKDEKINNELILLVIKNMLIALDKIYNKKIDVDFKISFTSILRSPFVSYTDEEIFKIYLENSFKENEVYLKLKKVADNISNLSIKEIIFSLIKEFNIYENIVKIGNIEFNYDILNYIIEMGYNFENIGYTIDEFISYLDEVIEKDYEIKLSHNIDSEDSVRIMTIHKSKGLEYHICYYPGLYENFNIRDLNERILYDENFGIVVPCFNEGIDDTIYKYLLKQNYIKEEISEKLRLFYVALTRAKEKMILVTDFTSDTFSSKNSEGIIEDSIRMKYRSFNDILLSIKDELKKYIKNIETINLTKDYNKIKSINIKDNIIITDEKIIVNEMENKNELLDENTFSKHITKLNSKEEIDNMNLGTFIHYLLEIVDLKEKNIDFIPKQYQDKILKFLNCNIMDNIEKGKIYKEYEFMYEEENKIYHGIIDLMVIYDDYVDIIDYKLKNVDDENYIKQLNGYKTYIENKTNKKVNIYLYSIIDEKIEKI